MGITTDSFAIENHSMIGLVAVDADGRLYRARADGRSVLIKTTLTDTPDAREVYRLRREHELLASLSCPGVPRVREMYEKGGCAALVFDDRGAEPLQHLITGQPWSLPAFLPLALSLVSTLECLHRNQVVHRNIQPSSILFNRVAGEVELIHFQFASRVSREHAALGAAEEIEGVLAYLAPEQTGRMNRAVDYRADFYALGVVFYELLTGQRPFEAADALEMVHCHLARTPRSPSSIVAGIPEPLSAIVMKLLAKLAEHRYQSAAGLHRDLERCRHEWAVTRRIEPFAIGMADQHDRFHLPQRLYGREQEVEILLEAFSRVAASGGLELVMVSGYSGIGKSALVAELHRPIVARRGYFIAGKFDQYRRGRPYETLAEAFQSLVQQILAEPTERIEAWRRRILDAVGELGQLITDLIPQVGLIIGAQPRVPDLPPDQAQHRLQRVFRRFVAAFTRPEQPLVLFLDDLQWVDATSLIAPLSAVHRHEYAPPPGHRRVSGQRSHRGRSAHVDAAGPARRGRCPFTPWSCDR